MSKTFEESIQELKSMYQAMKADFTKVSQAVETIGQEQAKYLALSSSNKDEETGMGEGFKDNANSKAYEWAANRKALFDDLMNQRRAELQESNELRTTLNKSLAVSFNRVNAIADSYMAAKLGQEIAHADMARENQWPDSPADGLKNPQHAGDNE